MPRVADRVPGRRSRRDGVSSPAGAVPVRRARPEEWAAYRKLRLRALAESPLAFGSTLAQERAYPAATWIQRTSRGALSDQAALYVAEAPGGLVGLGGIVWFGHRWNLVSMWVDPAWRGRGLGRQLLEALLGWLGRTHPGSSLWLEVTGRQLTARGLYASFGFHRTGVVHPLEHSPGERLWEMVHRAQSFQPTGSLK